MVKDKLMTKQKPDICPVYFLYGPEDYLIDKEIQKLLDRTLCQKERGLNLHLFSGEEHRGHEIVQAAQTLPMFSRYRFVLVSEADRIDEEEMELLLNYFKNPSPTTCLVLYDQTIGTWKAHRAEIERVGEMKEYPRLRGKALVSWVMKRMQEKEKGLSEEAANYLVEVVGDHLYDLDNALEKVSLSVGAKGAIELSDVEEITTEVKVSTVFDLTDAIGHQNLEKALKVLERALESKVVSFKKEEASKKMDDPVPLLLSMMAKQYWNILMVKEMASLHQEVGELAKTLRMSPWNIKKLMEQEKNFSQSSLREGIFKCHQADLAIKRGRGPKDLLMQKLVIDLCRPLHSTSPPFRKGGRRGFNS
jgi:DNA polymerase-3 subunit delta